MTFMKMLGVFTMSIFITGCLTSLHPFYTEKNLTFDSSLIGTWVSVDPETDKEDEEIALTFRKGGGKTYELIVKEKKYIISELTGFAGVMANIISGSLITSTNKQKLDNRQVKPEDKKSEPGEPAAFEAHLVKLKELLFLDISTKDWDVKNTVYAMHMVPVHTFSRISIKGDVLRIEMLDAGWFGKMVEQKKVTIGHVLTSERCILTASPQDLEEFVLKYADDKEAFSKAFVFHRKKE